MRRLAPFVLFVILLAPVASGASEDTNDRVLTYPGHKLRGKITAANVFTTCGKLKIDIQKLRSQFPDMKLAPSNGMHCQDISLNSVDGSAESSKEAAKEADRQELDEMMKEYKQDHSKLLVYREHQLLGQITAENVFTTCGGLEIDLQVLQKEYADIRLIPGDGMYCKEDDSLNGIDPAAKSSKDKAKEADRKELGAMTDEYEHDHEVHEQ